MTVFPLRILTASFLVFCVQISAAPAEENPEDKKKPETPRERVTKTGETTYRLGEITFDAKSREIRLPAVMNMPEGGPIEYLLIHESGKVHEGMLVTKARPLHLQIVMKLLKYQAGDGQIFDAFAPDEAQRRQLENPEKRKRGDAIRVSATWVTDDGEKREEPPAHWILDGFTHKQMTDEPWIFTGSHVMDGAFLADLDGTLIAIYLDQLALFNMTREGADEDARWGANEDATPPLGQKMTVILSPVKNSSQ